jgi:hypothetical protein
MGEELLGSTGEPPIATPILETLRTERMVWVLPDQLAD